ncbi:MAG: NAD(P)H-dependent oxidoreductase [Selenomonadaceae bacterium]|nr:NAD(P)H-dependent oxidoreductase [Selenomonadaceae bacterium]
MSKKLVAYFSASGVTRKLSNNLAEAIDADIYEIKPAVLYKGADLNWNNPKSRSSVEMDDKTSRPELADKEAKISDYDVIYIGFPIWWYVAPHIINSFLEAYDFSGKTIVIYATSGGSGFGNTIAELKPSAPNVAKWIEGKIFSGRTSQDELKKWSDNLNL